MQYYVFWCTSSLRFGVVVYEQIIADPISYDIKLGGGGGFVQLREFFTHMETSPLQVKDYNFFYLAC